jgi:hypothetical protein
MSTEVPLPSRIPEQYEAITVHRSIDLGLTPQRLAEANLLFADRGWFASPELTMIMPGPPNPRMSGIGWRSPDGCWQLFLQAQAVTLRLSPGAGGTESEPTTQSFGEVVAQVLPTILVAHGLTATRLIFKSREFIPEETIRDARQLQQRLFPPLPGSDRMAIPEFLWRRGTQSVRLIGQQLEPVYEGPMLEQFEHPGLLHGQPHHMLRLTLELNTSATDLTPRFGAAETAAFFTEVVAWQESLRADVLAVLA